MIFTKDDFGSTKTHIFAFLVSIPSLIVSHEEITITSLSSVVSNLFNILILSLPLIDELNPIIEIFLYFLSNFGNSFLQISLNTILNPFSLTKLFTDVSLSVFTSEWNVSTRLFPLLRIVRAMLSYTDLFVFSVYISIHISNGFK